MNVTSGLFVGMAAFFSVLVVTFTYIAGQLKNSEDEKVQRELTEKISEIAQLEKEKGLLQEKLTSLIENDLRPHIVYAATEYNDHKLKVLFHNAGDRILRNPFINYKVHTVAMKGDQVISNQEFENGQIDPLNAGDLYKSIKLGWKPNTNWEVEFPLRINQDIPPFERATITFSFNMSVAGYKAGATEEHSNFTRMIVHIDQLNTDRNTIKNEHSVLHFERAK